MFLCFYNILPAQAIGECAKPSDLADGAYHYVASDRVEYVCNHGYKMATNETDNNLHVRKCVHGEWIPDTVMSCERKIKKIPFVRVHVCICACPCMNVRVCMCECASVCACVSVCVCGAGGGGGGGCIPVAGGLVLIYM